MKATPYLCFELALFGFTFFANSVPAYISMYNFWYLEKIAQPEIPTKSQLISEWIYALWKFPKIDPKNLKDFCPDI